MNIARFLLTIIAASLLSGGIVAAADDDAAVHFREKVLPILTARCFKCHSHAGGLKGGLALDWKSGWQIGGDSGPAIVPGKPVESLLIQAVKRDGLKMPPEEALPAAEVAILTEWVRTGAADPRTAKPAASNVNSTDWWSLRTIQQPELPAAGLPGASSAIDVFLLAKLRGKGLSPAPPATRSQLLRRLSFDLHGLPPRWEEQTAFEQDPNPDAYERLVDRLLASPRVGERAARRWFDVIHYAETNGFEHDTARPNAWRYRDYTIDALNADVTWPQFIREQLAADAIYPEQPAKQAALGFLGAGPYDSSTAQTAPRTFDYLDRDDIVTQVMATFASATVNCARCHDHKFDPISQADHYALQAVFAGVTKGDVLFDADSKNGPERLKWRMIQEAAQRSDPAVVLATEHAAAIAAWEQANAGGGVAWERLEVLSLAAEHGSDLRPQDDGSYLAVGVRPDVETVTFTVRSPLPEVTALRLEVLSDPSLPHKGPGRQDNGNLHLSEFEVSVIAGSQPPQRVKVAAATADFNQEGWGVQRAIDGDPKTAWGIYPQVGQSHYAVFTFETPVKTTAETKLIVAVKQLHGAGHLIGRPRLLATNAKGSVAALPLAVDEALRRPTAERTREQQVLLAAHVLRLHAAEKLAKLPPPERVFGALHTVERDGKLAQVPQPKQVHVLARGNIEKPLEEAAAGSISSIAGLPGRFELASPGDGPRRAALANWLADSQNPLTWRSVVNRSWHDHFGKGLCDTPSDLGRGGGVPSHPELIDWLAAEFRDRGGQWKDLQRWLVTTAAYRQSSTSAREVAEVDADNRLLARMPRTRLDAESFRDAVLSAAEGMNLQMHGPSVQHFRTSPGPQATPKVDYTPFDWSTAAAARRSVYRFHWRGIPDPFFEALDFPDASLLQPTRPFSASPLQSLALLNDDFVLYHCQSLAAKIERDTADSQERLRIVMRQILLREPTAAELRLLPDLAAKHGLAAVCRVLFNSNEFLFCD